MMTSNIIDLNVGRSECGKIVYSELTLAYLDDQIQSIQLIPVQLVQQRTLALGRVIQFDWFGFSIFTTKYNMFASLVKSNPVQLETSRTVILHPLPP